MASKDLITRIVLKGQTDPSLTKAFQRVSNLSDSGLQNIQKAGQTVAKIAKVAAGATVAGLSASVKASIDYESAFAGVLKTVDETATTTYDDLSEGIRNMAKELPASASEIAGVAEAAGQLGIKADDILGFTKTMINLGESTNLTSDEAATSIAKLFNVTGTSMKDVDKFGATLVDLGNNAATTEADILNMATRIASSATMVGMSETEMLALATSLSSVGLEAEGGGTAISTVMSNIDKAVGLNSESLKTWAGTAGMSVSEFKTLWEEDAYGAMQKIIGGMADTNASGGNLNVLLEELGITGIRTSDTMKRLSNASGLMSDMTDLANKAWGDNTALTEEAGRRYATMQAKISMMKNRFVDMGITIGDRLMPFVQKLMDKLMEVDFDALADKIATAIEKIIGFISQHSTTIMTIIGAIGGAIVGIKIAGIIKGIMTAISIIKTLISVFGFAKVALAALGGPVTIVIAVIMALVGAFVALWNKSEAFRNFWINLWEKIKSILRTVIEFVKTNWKSLLMLLVNPFVGAFRLLYDNCEGFRNTVNNLVAKVKSAFNSAVAFIASLPGRIWTWLLNVIARIKAWASDMKAKALDAARNLVDTVVTKISELPAKMLEAGKNLVKGLWEGITGAGNWLKDKITGFANGIIDKFKNVFDINSPSGVMENAVGKFLPSGLAVGVQKNMGTAIKAVKGMGEKITKTASNISPVFTAKAQAVGGKIRAFAKGGTVTQPELALVGDAKETIVPHGNTSRNRSLLKEAAMGVGARLGNQINITFAPVIQGGNAEANRKMIEEEMQKFKQMMQEYFEGEARLAF